MLFKDCDLDYLPGRVFRWTLTGDHQGTEDEHPDDLVTCAQCNGSGRVPMRPSDFLDWGEPVPPGVVAEAIS